MPSNDLADPASDRRDPTLSESPAAAPVNARGPRLQMINAVEPDFDDDDLAEIDSPVDPGSDRAMLDPAEQRRRLKARSENLHRLREEDIEKFVRGEYDKYTVRGRACRKQLDGDKAQPLDESVDIHLDQVTPDPKNSAVHLVRLTDGTELADTPSQIRFIKGDVYRDQCPETMIALVRARGWKSVKLTGDGEFKTAMWVAMQEAGIKVRNFKPSQQQLAVYEAKKEAAMDQGAGVTAVDPMAMARERAMQMRKEDPKSAFIDLVYQRSGAWEALLDSDGPEADKARKNFPLAMELMDGLPFMDDMSLLARAREAFEADDLNLALSIMATDPETNADAAKREIDRLSRAIRFDNQLHRDYLTEKLENGDQDAAATEEIGKWLQQLDEIDHATETCNDIGRLRVALDGIRNAQLDGVIKALTDPDWQPETRADRPAMPSEPNPDAQAAAPTLGARGSSGSAPGLI